MSLLAILGVILGVMTLAYLVADVVGDMIEAPAKRFF